MTIVPGFIECHNHAPGNTLLYEVLVGNPYVVEFVTIAGIVDKLRAKARDTPPGFWVDGYFFDDTKVKDNRQLNVHDLDQDANGDLNGRVTDPARNALNRTGKRPSFTEEQRLQRDREGLAYIFKQFVRYGVTSLHHQGGNLAALQQVGRAESSCTA